MANWRLQEIMEQFAEVAPADCWHLIGRGFVVRLEEGELKVVDTADAVVPLFVVKRLRELNGGFFNPFRSLVSSRNDQCLWYLNQLRKRRVYGVS